MPSPIIEQFWQDLVSDIQRNRITLPALPEIALKARRLVNQPDTTTAELAKLIQTDVILSTRLIRVANSPMYRTAKLIDTVKLSLTRLGLKNVSNIITSLTMEQLYQTKLPQNIRKLVRANWLHGVHVAAISQVIAARHHNLNNDEALLGGLIHDIGVLPIFEYSQLMPEFSNNPQALKKLVTVLHARIGGMILTSWKFSPELISVAANHETFDHENNGMPDLTDVVTVANLLSYVGTDHPHTQLNWSDIPAFKNLGMLPEESIQVIHEARDEIAENRSMLSS